MSEEQEQLDLVPVEDVRAAAAPPEPVLVARVAVETPLAHLDRLFDYAVPDTLVDDVAAGCRVKVRFAGRLTTGFVASLETTTRHDGGLSPLASVVSPEPVLQPQILALAREVADRWAGTLSDVLRLAVPPRQARVEAQPAQPSTAQTSTAQTSTAQTSTAQTSTAQTSDGTGGDLPSLADDSWQPWPDGPAFVASLAAGGSPRACWSALPLRDPARAVAEASLATLHSGRGAVICVPDARDLARWDAVFTEVLGEGRHVVLSSAQKPAARYRAFLAAARGRVRVVLGTRAAAFAPVDDLGLVCLWDDGDDLFVEPRAPYHHAREVLLMRAAHERAGVLLAGYARTAEAQSLVSSGWCRSLEAEAVTRRRAWPRVTVTDGSEAGGAPARLPREVFRAVRAADGPVLVQVPRRGYRAALSCQDCRTPARCRTCEGPLAQPTRGADPTCRWCGRRASPWTCPACGSARLRAPVVGQLRTAEEYAAAFPDREILTSGGDGVLDRIEHPRALVLATPGAEPVAPEGYALVVLMDTWLLLAREDVRVVEEAHRRWLNAIALARESGSAIAVGDPAALQGLVRADPIGLAARELADRTEARLPPAARLAVVDGPPEVMTDLVQRPWTPHSQVLGPVPTENGERIVVRCPRTEGARLSAGLKQAQAERTKAKLPILRVRVDPHVL